MAVAVRRLVYVVVSAVLVGALGTAAYLRHELQTMERRTRATERALLTALAAIRARDSALANVRDRVDTSLLPALPDVVSRARARTEMGASADVSTAGWVTLLENARGRLGKLAVTPLSCGEPAVAARSEVAVDDVPPERADTVRLTLQGSPPLRLPGHVSAARANLTYLGLLTTADLSNAWLHFDQDHGGYVDTWNTQDKLAHAAMGALLAETAIDAGVRPPWAVALTCAGAAGFEWSQGYASRKDLIAGCAGAAAGAGVHWGAAKLFRRSR